MFVSYMNEKWELKMNFFPKGLVVCISVALKGGHPECPHGNEVPSSGSFWEKFPTALLPLGQILKLFVHFFQALSV